MESNVFVYFLAGVILITGILIGYGIGKIVNYRFVRQQRKEAISKSKSVIL